MCWKCPWMTTRTSNNLAGTMTSPQTKASDQPMWRHLAVGAGVGIIQGVALLAVTSLSPLAALDRRALALIALTLALPLGVMMSLTPTALRQAGLPAFRAIACALTLAMVLGAGDVGMAGALTLWLCPAMVIGASLGSLDRRGLTGAAAAGGWLVLCAAPFFYQVFEGTMLEGGIRLWALQGCPWLGFAQAHLSLDPSRPLDPLRQDIIYMGHWSGLTDMPASDLLAPKTLWWLATLALAAALVRRFKTDA